MFVSFEGIDGSGKTTQARLLAEALEREGVDVVLTREPGGTPLGEEVRNLVLHGDHVAPWAEVALYAAARAQHVDQVIRPALERGATVVCDRYVDSSVAYQGGGRHLGIDTVLELNLAVVGGLLPDRTVLVEIAPETAAGARRGQRRPDRARRESRSGRAPPRPTACSRPAIHGGTSSSTASARSRSSPRRSVATFADVPEQREAKRLLEAALADGPAHAYLFHGPAGVGKRVAANALAGELLGDPRRVDARTHPDLQVIEALGEMIRIDEIRALHHDLHMRPFEGDRRVYLVLDAHRLNDDAAASLLKDLEEPPAYATLVLVADELGPLPETIRSRCQLVPFRRLSRGAVEAWLTERADGLPADEVRLLARVAGGRLDRAARLLDEAARARRAALLDAARAAYRDDEFDPAAAAGGRPRRGERARRRRRASASETLVEGLDLPTREAEQRVRRAGFGAERGELLAALDDLGGWYRDLVVVAGGAESAVVERGSARRADRGRAGGGRRGGGRRRGGAGDVADRGGVQRLRVARARGALRPPAADVQPRSPSRTVKRKRPRLRARVDDRRLALTRADARDHERRRPRSRQLAGTERRCRTRRRRDRRRRACR